MTGQGTKGDTGKEGYGAPVGIGGLAKDSGNPVGTGIGSHL